MNSRFTPDRQALVGTVLTCAVAAVLLLDAAMQLAAPAPLIAAMEHTGFPTHAAPLLAVVMTVCAITLLIPRTSILGAILTTGFFGGAIAIHVRIGEIAAPSQIACLLMGVTVWAGIYLRHPRLRDLLRSRAHSAH